MNVRIYIVTEKDDEIAIKHLVRASNPAAAIRHVVRQIFSAEVAGVDDALELQAKGVKVEEANREPQA